MAFDQSCGGEKIISEAYTPCTIDYERQAVKAKKKMLAAENLEEALGVFQRVVGTYAFKKISSFAEMLGGVTLTKMQYTQEHSELLELMEKETEK